MLHLDLSHLADAAIHCVDAYNSSILLLHLDLSHLEAKVVMILFVTMLHLDLPHLADATIDCVDSYCSCTLVCRILRRSGDGLVTILRFDLR